MGKSNTVQQVNTALVAAPGEVIELLTQYLAEVPEDQLDLFLAKAVLLSGVAMPGAEFEAILCQAAQDL